MHFSPSSTTRVALVACLLGASLIVAPPPDVCAFLDNFDLATYLNAGLDIAIPDIFGNLNQYLYTSGIPNMSTLPNVHSVVNSDCDVANEERAFKDAGMNVSGPAMPKNWIAHNGSGDSYTTHTTGTQNIFMRYQHQPPQVRCRGSADNCGYIMRRRKMPVKLMRAPTAKGGSKEWEWQEHL